MIELIVFDIDGTLYDLNDVITMNYKIQVDFISESFGWAQEKTKKFFSENNIYSFISDNSRSATELFIRLGLSREDWNVYREEHFDVNAINKEKAVTNTIIREFSSLCDIILLSSNSYKNIVKILNHINVDINLFSEIVCSDRFPVHSKFNKKEAFIYLSNTRKIKPANIISIGDRYQTDVKPLLELGGRGIVVSNIKGLKDFYDSILNKSLISSNNFIFYNSL